MVYLSLRIGRIETFFYLMNETCCSVDHRAMNTACENGNYKVVEFLNSKGVKATTNGMDLASSNGHLRVVEFLHENRTEGFRAQSTL